MVMAIAPPTDGSGVIAEMLVLSQERVEGHMARVNRSDAPYHAAVDRPSIVGSMPVRLAQPWRLR